MCVFGGAGQGRERGGRGKDGEGKVRQGKGGAMRASLMEGSHLMQTAVGKQRWREGQSGPTCL